MCGKLKQYKTIIFCLRVLRENKYITIVTCKLGVEWLDPKFSQVLIFSRHR